MGKFDGYIPMFSRTDPRTSRLAAEKMTESGAAELQRNKCLERIRLEPGLTAAELAKNIGLERHAPSRRLPELREMGLVRNGETRVCSVTGNRSITWYAV